MSDWCQQAGHPYLQAITQILNDLLTWPYIDRLEFLLPPAPIHWPTCRLDLIDNHHPLKSPSVAFNHLETQKIYSFTTEDSINSV